MKKVLRDAVRWFNLVLVTRSMSATGLEAWAKALVLETADAIGRPHKTLGKIFQTTLTTIPSIRSMAALFLEAVGMVNAATSPVWSRVKMYNLVNEQVHWFLQRGFNAQAYLLSASFSFALAHYPAMFAAWQKIRNENAGTASNLEYLSILLEKDDLVLSRAFQSSPAGRYALAFDLASAWVAAKQKTKRDAHVLARVAEIADALQTREDVAEHIEMLQAVQDVFVSFQRAGSIALCGELEKWKVDMEAKAVSYPRRKQSLKKRVVDLGERTAANSVIRAAPPVPQHYQPDDYDDTLVLRRAFETGFQEW